MENEKNIFDSEVARLWIEEANTSSSFNHLLFVDDSSNDLKYSIHYLISLLEQYEKIIPGLFISNYFDDLRNKVDLHREEKIRQIIENKTIINSKENTINEINFKSNEIIQTLYDKEKKCELNKSSKPVKKDLNNLIKYLKQDDFVDQINQTIHFIRKEIRLLKYNLLLGESIEFEKFENNSLFGKLSINKLNLDLSEDFGRLIKELNGHLNIIYSIQVEEKTNKLISAGDNEIKVWNLETGECLKTLNENLITSTILIIGSNNNTLISGSDDKNIKIWNLDTFECVKTLKDGSDIGSLCLISENKLACGCQDGMISVWDLNIFNKLKSFTAHDTFDRINCLKLTQDSTKLITSCSMDTKNTIKLWDAVNFENFGELVGHLNSIMCFELTLNGNLLSASNDKLVKLWNLETCECLKTIVFDNDVYCMRQITSDLIAVGTSRKKGQNLIIYDVKNEQEIKNNLSNDCYICTINLLSNGYLVTGCGNGKIKLWKILDN
jgi:WD40 repeat protein